MVLTPSGTEFSVAIPHAGILKFGLIITLLLAITLMILGGIIWNSSESLPDTDERTKILKCSQGIVGTAVGVLVLNGIFYLLYRKNF